MSGEQEAIEGIVSEQELTMEESVRNDLATLPLAMRRGGVAGVAIMAARVLDEGGLTPRDAAGFARELRLALAQLRAMTPGDVKGDVTDEVKMRRERRLAGELYCKGRRSRVARQTFPYPTGLVLSAPTASARSVPTIQAQSSRSSPC